MKVRFDHLTAIYLLCLCLTLAGCTHTSRDWSAHDWAERSPAWACEIEPVSEAEPDVRIESVALQEQMVFAITEQGMYRASRQDQEWQTLICNDLPFPGEFIQSYGGVLLYFAPARGIPQGMGAYWSTSYPQPITIITPTPADSPAGSLFISTNQGETWHLVSDAHQFLYMFLHRDGTLYAIATTPMPPPDPTMEARVIPWFVHNSDGSGYFVRDRVLMSQDYGRSWRDITGDIPADMQLYSLFEDPNNPQLIAIQANQRRGYIYTAENKDYAWQGERELWYIENSAPDSYFFQDYGWPTFAATLSNYFVHDFGEAVKHSVFVLETERTVYEFDIDQSKSVSIGIKALGEPEGLLVDAEPAHYFWDARLISPRGDRIKAYSRAWTGQYSDEDELAAVKQAYCQSPELERFQVEPTQVYTRTIDLDALYDFRMPGIYQAQIIYSSESWYCEGADWIEAEFATPVFTLRLLE